MEQTALAHSGGKLGYFYNCTPLAHSGGKLGYFYNCTPPMDDNFRLLSPEQDFSIILPPDTEILTSGRVWFLMLPLDIIFYPWTTWISQ